MKPWSVSTPVPGASLTTLLFAVVIVACVYIGRDVLVPMTLAILMSFVLAPPVDFLQRWYVPRIVAVIGVVLLAFAGVFSLGGLMISQVNQLASDLPRYQSTLREKIQNLRGIAAGTGTLERASEVLRNLSREIDRPNITGLSPAAPSALPTSPDRHPGRGQATRPRRAANVGGAHRAAHSSAGDDRHYRHLHHLHSHSKTRLEE
jgi:hypothetical protein